MLCLCRDSRTVQCVPSSQQSSYNNRFRLKAVPYGSTYAQTRFVFTLGQCHAIAGLRTRRDDVCLWITAVCTTVCAYERMCRQRECSARVFLVLAISKQIRSCACGRVEMIKSHLFCLQCARLASGLFHLLKPVILALAHKSYEALHDLSIATLYRCNV